LPCEPANLQLLSRSMRRLQDKTGKDVTISDTGNLVLSSSSAEPSTMCLFSCYTHKGELETFWATLSFEEKFLTVSSQGELAFGKHRYFWQILVYKRMGLSDLCGLRNHLGKYLSANPSGKLTAGVSSVTVDQKFKITGSEPLVPRPEPPAISSSPAFTPRTMAPNPAPTAARQFTAPKFPPVSNRMPSSISVPQLQSTNESLSRPPALASHFQQPTRFASTRAQPPKPPITILSTAVRMEVTNFISSYFNRLCFSITKSAGSQGIDTCSSDCDFR
jgi:hypothetical protein